MEPQQEESLEVSEAWHPATYAFLLFLVVFLPFQLWRASLEGSFWKDESFTLMLIFHDWKEMIRLNIGVGAHPPFYYLVLKSWNHGLVSLLGEASGLWALRVSSVITWVTMVVMGYCLAKRTLGNWAALGFVLLLAINPDVSQYQLYVRNYSFVYLGTVGLILTFMELARRGEEGGDQRWFWGLYVLFGVFALYSNLLMGVLLFLLGCWWLWISFFKGLRSEFCRWGAGAQLLINLAFVPYVLWGLSGNVNRVGEVNDYMPDATFGALAQYFYDWFLWGGLVGMRDVLLMGVFGLGAVFLLLPLAMLAWVSDRDQSEFGQPEDPVVRLFKIAGSVGLVYVLILWLLGMTGIYQMYHPRYLTPASIPLLLALVAALKIVADRWGRGALVVVFGFLPLLAISGFGTYRNIQLHERSGGPVRYIVEFQPFLDQAGEHLYIMPSEMIPIYRQTLSPWGGGKPVEDFIALMDKGELPERAVVLDLSRFHYLDFDRDLKLRYRLDTGIDGYTTDVLESAEEADGEKGLVYTGNDYFNKAWLLVRE